MEPSAPDWPSWPTTAPAPAFSSVISITCEAQGLTVMTRPTMPPDVTTGMLVSTPALLPRLIARDHACRNGLDVGLFVEIEQRFETFVFGFRRAGVVKLRFNFSQTLLQLLVLSRGAAEVPDLREEAGSGAGSF